MGQDFSLRDKISQQNIWKRLWFEFLVHRERFLQSYNESCRFCIFVILSMSHLQSGSFCNDFNCFIRWHEGRTERYKHHLIKKIKESLVIDRKIGRFCHKFRVEFRFAWKWWKERGDNIGPLDSIHDTFTPNTKVKALSFAQVFLNCRKLIWNSLVKFKNLRENYLINKQWDSFVKHVEISENFSQFVLIWEKLSNVEPIVVLGCTPNGQLQSVHR